MVISSSTSITSYYYRGLNPGNYPDESLISLEKSMTLDLIST